MGNTSPLAGTSRRQYPVENNKAYSSRGEGRASVLAHLALGTREHGELLGVGEPRTHRRRPRSPRHLTERSIEDHHRHLGCRPGFARCIPGKKTLFNASAPSPTPLIGATVIAGGMVALTPAAQAIGIPVACSENALVAAVNLANSTAAADTLTLASGCTYSMTSSHGSFANGQEALPVIRGCAHQRQRRR